jgi:hypothetical protein
MRAIHMANSYRDGGISGLEISLMSNPSGMDDHKDEETLRRLSKAIKTNGTITISSGDVSVVISGNDLI